MHKWKNKKQIRIAADSNIIISLSRYNDINLDRTREVHDAVASGKDFFEKKYGDMPYDQLPPILKDNYIGNKSDRYQNLFDISKLMLSISTGVVELYVTPGVFFECDYPHTREFMNKYCKFLYVRDDDQHEFKTMRDKLAKKYCEVGAMETIRDIKTMTIRPDDDAYLMAEASLFGLDFLTSNEKHFVHTYYKKDYDRQDLISRTNEQVGLIYTSNKTDGKFVPSSTSLGSFVAKLNRTLKTDYLIPQSTNEHFGINGEFLI